MFSENTLLLSQQDLKLGPYFVKWQLEIDRGWPRFPIKYFAIMFTSLWRKGLKEYLQETEGFKVFIRPQFSSKWPTVHIRIINPNTCMQIVSHVIKLYYNNQ